VRAVVVVGMAAAALAIASVVLFLWPPSDDPQRADALVILGPGRNGERLNKGLELLEQGVAPVVVVSHSRRPAHWPLEQTLCARARSRCFRADPFTTRGEAREVARLVEANDWGSIVVVTSSYHVVRARLLYGRCLGGRVSVVGAEPGTPLSGLVRSIVHEWGGLAYALTFARGC
jgi:uncharacterized SAM-binding protein YcdF (DUF218 family)